MLTLPASFDEVARELTVKAAARAGLAAGRADRGAAGGVLRLDLRPRRRLAERVEPGQKILVCDVGGGTSDFTLIRVRAGRRAARSSSTAWPWATT